MCDTLVATPDATKNGVAIFAKNSDREPNEAQQIISIAAKDYSPGSSVSCTYIEIPQAPHTNAVVLSKPFWIWGAEMGANEYGVVIGNEAVFSKVPAPRQNALIGMDLLRLGLERAQTARRAIEVMTELQERFGQGGNCGFKHKTFYHNSFIAADPHEAWLLETINKSWAAKQIHGLYAISNGLTIDRNWDYGSEGLINDAVQKKWCANRDDFNFARCYSDLIYTKFSDSRRRRNRAMDLLEQNKNSLDITKVISILRDHGNLSHDWRPDKGITGCSICMHAGFGPVRFSQTTGSMVSWLHPDRAAHFFTGTAAPCTGIFKPVWTDVPIPDTGAEPSGVYDGSSLFWRHEKLHRAILKDYNGLLPLYQDERDTLEHKFINAALDSAFKDVDFRSELSQKCFREALDSENIWLQKIQNKDGKKRSNRLYSFAWNRLNRQARMPSE